jgi:molybdopterin converting factor small subunit
MRITIAYFGQARVLAGTRTEQVEWPDGASPGEVLRNLAGKHGEAFDRLLFNEQGQLRRSVLLAVGSTTCGADEKGLLKDGDELAVQTAISGG